MKTLFLHIGIPKTATTFLQKSFFPAIDSVHYYTKKETTKILGEPIYNIFRKEPIIWKHNETIHNFINNIIEKSNRKHILISEECIFGGQFSPSSKRQWGNNISSICRDSYGIYTLCKHLKEFKHLAEKNNVKKFVVIVTIRRQDTKMASSYAEISSGLHNASQKDFEEWVYKIFSKENYYDRNGDCKLNYFWLYDCLQEVLGKENIYFIPYEELKINSDNYYNIWNKILCKDININNLNIISKNNFNKKSAGLNNWKISKAQYMGPRFRPPSKFLDSLGLPNRVPASLMEWKREENFTLTDELSEYILDKFHLSNSKLNNYIDNTDLKKLGYC